MVTWKFLKKFSFASFNQSIENSFRSIECSFLIDRRGIENRLIQAETLWWNSSLSRLIENSLRSIKCCFRSIEQESRINRTSQWLCDEFLRSIEKKVWPIEGTEFWIFTCFLLSVKTLIKSKAMCDEITFYIKWLIFIVLKS